MSRDGNSGSMWGPFVGAALCKLPKVVSSFANSHDGFRGSVLVRVSLHNVGEERMTFDHLGDAFFADPSPNDFRCIAEVVSTERLFVFGRCLRTVPWLTATNLSPASKPY
jgi:hypothetical protein